jgi:hypothetical protein
MLKVQGTKGKPRSAPEKRVRTTKEEDQQQPKEKERNKTRHWLASDAPVKML